VMLVGWGTERLKNGSQLDYFTVGSAGWLPTKGVSPHDFRACQLPYRALLLT